MMMSDDKVGGWVKKGQNHDDVILECPLISSCSYCMFSSTLKFTIFSKVQNTVKVHDVTPRFLSGCISSSMFKVHNFILFSVFCTLKFTIFGTFYHKDLFETNLKKLYSIFCYIKLLT